MGLSGITPYKKLAEAELYFLHAAKMGRLQTPFLRS